MVGTDVLQSIEAVEGDQKRRGMKYEVATGDLIPNLGEKRFIGTSDDYVTRGITAQAADVNQALLSVRKLVAAGYRVTFDSDGSYIEDKENGEHMMLRDDGSMYLLKLWVRKEGF